ncbi:cytochrome P450 [Penicillium malachiteum]|uniref:Cytochrome P450 n=1 Tax=Penicillium malachiteum TaxID=1324776 RepID=A0AAD6MZI5_9EURO|nr:cytochrome P450 [Penicillium malachiteum]
MSWAALSAGMELPIVPLSTYILGFSALPALIWMLYGIIWRLYWSPIANFPGPKSVALTHWVEFYYDVVKDGMFMWEIEKMHKKYVRVSPYELHCNDPEFYNTIYASPPEQRDKYLRATRSPDCNNATGFTVEHAHHRLRREALAPFFSKRNTVLMEDDIKACVDTLCENMGKNKDPGNPFNLTVGSLATTMDILTCYCFGVPFGLQKDEDLAIKWRDTIFHVMRALPMIRKFPLLARVVEVLPPSISAFVLPDLSVLQEWKSVQQVLGYEGIYAKADRGKKTVMEQLRDYEKLPPPEKTHQRLSEECAILTIAGSETPAKANAMLWYHLLDNPDKLSKLRAEIKQVYPDPKMALPPVSILEGIPYLVACVLEGLRMQSGVVGRSQRVAQTPMHYKEFTIPAQTPISSVSFFQNYHEVIFPEPHAFVPERWLVQDEEGLKVNHDLKRYLRAFGHGSRNCLGYNLAFAELYLLTAALATRMELELFQTTIDDVAIQRDWTIPQANPDSKGIRVIVRDYFC